MKNLITAIFGLGFIVLWAVAAIASVALPVLGCVWLWNNI